MNWHAVRSEFARLKKPVDESVVEEFAQHAAAAFEEARADGASPGQTDAAITSLIESWCQATSADGVLEQVMTMETRLMNSLAKPRLYAVLLGGFAAFATLIAGIGLFGGLSYAVTLRRREIGVRTALGATPRDIVGLVVKQGAVMTVLGLSIGFGAAASTGRYLSGFLFGVTPFDPMSFAIVGVALMLVAIVACGIPARRPARIDPIIALKH